MRQQQCRRLEYGSTVSVRVRASKNNGHDLVTIHARNVPQALEGHRYSADEMLSAGDAMVVVHELDHERNDISSTDKI